MPEEKIILRKGKRLAIHPINIIGGELPPNVKLEMETYTSETHQESEIAKLAAQQFPHIQLTVELSHPEKIPEELIDELIEIAETYVNNQRRLREETGIHPELGYSVEEWHDERGHHRVRLSMKGITMSAASLQVIVSAINKYREHFSK